LEVPVREYLNTREVAGYLKLNEKKIYALVAAGQLPAARVSGKWLFPRDLVDRWVEENTFYPSSGVMGAMLDELVVMQGSDDWLLSTCVDGLAARPDDFQVVEASVGSLAGLAAVDRGVAHIAGCHVQTPEIVSAIARKGGGYRIHLFSRTQGLLLDHQRHPKVSGMADVARDGLRFADRQESSGTWQLARRMLAKEGRRGDELVTVGPYSSHLEVALAIRRGLADVGLGSRIAAELCGLDFAPLMDEAFQLVLPIAYASHARMARFLDATLDSLRAHRDTPGYDLTHVGRMEVIPPKHANPS
jgi:putative molybdopterin biosynthesis protein